MSIRDNEDWQTVELKAQLAEAGEIHTPKVPTPTIEQQLLWATQRCAELQAKIYRLQGHASSALMWLSVHETQRAVEEINRCILDIPDEIFNVKSLTQVDLDEANKVAAYKLERTT